MSLTKFLLLFVFILPELSLAQPDNLNAQEIYLSGCMSNKDAVLEDCAESLADWVDKGAKSETFNDLIKAGFESALEECMGRGRSSTDCLMDLIGHSEEDGEGSVIL